ncbi:hypothetical protein FKM82_012332 [Ascaphus truei]
MHSYFLLVDLTLYALLPDSNAMCLAIKTRFDIDQAILFLDSVHQVMDTIRIEVGFIVLHFVWHDLDRKMPHNRKQLAFSML